MNNKPTNEQDLQDIRLSASVSDCHEAEITYDDLGNELCEFCGLRCYPIDPKN